MKAGALTVLLVLAVAGPACAAVVTPATLGFDPARFGVPIYPNSSVKVAAAGNQISGRGERTAVLESTDTVFAVASWYGANWPGAVSKNYPGVGSAAQFTRPWGSTAITVSIARDGPLTDIRIVVPGTY
jgi:hypothetical protein